VEGAGVKRETEEGETGEKGEYWGEEE